MNINVNIQNATIHVNDAPDDIPGCDLGARDFRAEADRFREELALLGLDGLVRLLSSPNYCALADLSKYYDINPYDHLAEPLTDWPVEFTFSLPGIPGLRCDGFVPAKRLKAELKRNDAIGFHYVIHGNTVPSRKLLRDAGCEYGQTCGWICKDYMLLQPYVDDDSLPGCDIEARDHLLRHLDGWSSDRTNNFTYII